MFRYRYIDLFSGIGAFHIAMDSLGGKCVFASEIDKNCVEVYKKNFGLDSFCDITKISEKDIPEHDVLCAGFPCQAFSKAGKQGGINDARGTLFFEIARILKYHHTKYIILENVRNLVRHDNGNTWKTIQLILKNLGYRLTEKPLILSPHQFGIPQLRERVFILGVYDPDNVEKPLIIKLPHLLKKEDNSIYKILDDNDSSFLNLDSRYDFDMEVIDMWNEFYKVLNRKVIGFPVWAEYFKKSADPSFPKWKIDIINKNHKLYKENKEQIDAWLKKYRLLIKFPVSRTKFERQAGDNINSIYDGVIQFRPSGIRVKKPDVFPSLVAIVQIPYIGKYKRKLTVRECARLQSFPENFVFDDNEHAAFKQFGNSANVEIIKTLGKLLFDEENNHGCL